MKIQVPNKQLVSQDTDNQRSVRRSFWFESKKSGFSSFCLLVCFACVVIVHQTNHPLFDVCSNEVVFNSLFTIYFVDTSRKKESNKVIGTMSGKVLIDSALKAAVNVQSSKLPSEVAKASAALLSSLAGTTHTLPDLPYDYNALERKSVYR